MGNKNLTSPQRHALEQIQALCKDHHLTLDDLQSALRLEKSSETNTDTNTRQGFLTAMLGYLGGTLIVTGFFFYVGVVWDDLGSFARVLLSLGTGLLCFFIGGTLQKRQMYERAAPFLWVLSFIMIPTGLFVFLHEYVKGDDPIMGGVIVFGLCSAMFLTMWKTTQTKTLFVASLFFVMAFLGTTYEKLSLNVPGMWLFTGLSILMIGYHILKKGRLWEADHVLSIGVISFSVSLYYYLGNTTYEILITTIMLSLIFGGFIMKCKKFATLSLLIFIGLASKHYGFSAGYRDSDILRMTAAITGLSIALCGHWIQTNTISKISPPFWYFIGSTLFFSAIMGLLYETPYDIAFVIFPAIALYISLQLRSRTLLVTSIMAILAFISYYTFKYFADTVGWPLALMVMGLALIGLCAFAMKMNKRIISQTT